MFSKIVLFVLFATGGAACTESIPAPDTTAVAVESGEHCGRLEIDSTQSDPLALVLEAASRARERDARCGPPGPQRRVCRALWLAGQLDPVPLIASGGGMGATHLELLLWALNDGAEASTGDLSLAFSELGALTVDLSTINLSTDPTVTARSASDLASILVQRGSDSILDPVRRAEAVC